MKTACLSFLPLFTTLLALAISPLAAQEAKPMWKSYFGRAPRLDGVISPGEWSDATSINGVRNWVAEFSLVTEDRNLSLKGYVKHDREWIYFAFDVGDDVLYGIDTPRWLPEENPKAHDLTREGFPWFGNEMEKKEKGRGNFGNFHHEQWFAGVPHLRTQKRHWGTLRLMGRVSKPRPPK